MDDFYALAQQARDTFSNPIITGFRVGAALQTHDGKIFLGANIENRTLALTVCAERNALFNALMNGAHAMEFRAISVAGPDSEPSVAPCGPCLQLLREYCGLDLIVTFRWDGQLIAKPLSELFPFPTAQ